MRPLGDGEVGRNSHRLWGIALGAVAAIAVCAAVAGAAGVGNLPTGVPPGGGPTYAGSLTRILRPSTDALVRNGHLTVRVRSRVSLRGLHVLLNGHGITRRLRRVGGVYTAGLGLESPL